jgi:hypothetical protein
MAIFGPRANVFMNAALIGAAGVVAALLLAVWVVPVIGYNTQGGLLQSSPYRSVTSITLAASASTAAIAMPTLKNRRTPGCRPRRLA